MQNFRQSSIVIEKHDILSEKLKIFDDLQLSLSLTFFTEIVRTNVYKRVFGIFLFCLDLELLIKT